MAKYQDPVTKEVIEVGVPEINPQLIAGKIQVPESTPLGTITADSLRPQPDISSQITQPVFPPVSPVTVPALPLGVEQQKESDISKRIQQLTEILAGAPAFEIEQRGKLGIEQKITTQESILNQLQNLKAFTENIPAQIQEEFAGRGVTKGGVAPIEMGRLRQAGIQATILNAQFNAATGDLATAERQVKQAVQDKFGPKEAERNALLANLKLVKDSPEATNEQKARADAQTAKIKADEAKAETTKKIYEDIIKMSTQVAGSETQDGKNALIANQITDLVVGDKGLRATIEDFTKAQSLAAPYLVKKISVPSDVQTFNALFPDVKIGTPEGREQFLEWKAREAAAGRAPEKPEKVKFASTQIAGGAATAELPIADFQKLDIDTQNFFINNSDKIKAKKKLIDEARVSKQDPQSIKDEINASDSPQAAKDLLIKYVNSQFPKQEETSLPWWKRGINFFLPESKEFK